MLAKAGATASSASQRDPRRLTCYMTLFRELIETKSFGPLQPVMEGIFSEATRCLYTDRLCASYAPGIAKAVQEMCKGGTVGPERDVHRVPYFVSVEAAERAAQEASTEREAFRRRALEAEGAGADLREQCTALKEREEELLSEIQVLQAQVERLQGELARLSEDSQASRDKQNAEAQGLKEEAEKWRRAADRASLELSYMKAQRREDAGLRETFEALRLTTGLEGQSEKDVFSAPEEAARRLHDQLTVLLHARIDEFEAALQEAAGPLEEERLRDSFVPETTMVYDEIKALRNYMEDQPADGGPLRQASHHRGRSNAIVAQSSTEGEHGNGESAFVFPDELVKRMEELEASAARGGAQADGSPGTLNQGDALWRGFLQRCDPTFRIPTVPRNVTLSRTLRLIEETFRAKFEQDEDLHHHQPMSDFFYSYISDVYGVQHVALLVAHGVVSSLSRLRSSHPVVELFAALLTGEADEAAWKYGMRWRAALAECPVASAGDLGHFLDRLYPDYPEHVVSQMLDRFQEEFAACTSDNAVAFLTSRLMAGEDPRAKKYLKMLRWRDPNRAGRMRGSAFTRLAEEAFPGLPPGLARHHFDTAAVKHGGQVPMESLALVCCCLEGHAPGGGSRNEAE
eukprot:evm.model.scf_252EXC.4 EVM.evm.TU.scf_252EXC.4   scf_252EXC:55928-61938(+)